TSRSGSGRVRRVPVAPLAGQLPAFLLGEAAEDPEVQSGLQRVAQTLLPDGAACTDGLGLLRLLSAGAHGGDGEEQLRVLVAAGGVVDPAQILGSVERVPDERGLLWCGHGLPP